MTQELPNISDILRNISDPDISFVENPNKMEKAGESTASNTPKPQNQERTRAEGSTAEKPKDKPLKISKEGKAPAIRLNQQTIKAERQANLAQTGDPFWLHFINQLRHIEEGDERHSKKDYIVRLAPVLAATLDECNIEGCSRSDIVNAIVHSFLDLYMEQLIPYRTNVKMRTLFDNPKKP